MSTHAIDLTSMHSLQFHSQSLLLRQSQVAANALSLCFKFLFASCQFLLFSSLRILCSEAKTILPRGQLQEKYFVLKSFPIGTLLMGKAHIRAFHKYETQQFFAREM